MILKWQFRIPRPGIPHPFLKVEDGPSFPDSAVPVKQEKEKILKVMRVHRVWGRPAGRRHAQKERMLRMAWTVPLNSCERPCC